MKLINSFSIKLLGKAYFLITYYLHHRPRISLGEGSSINFVLPPQSHLSGNGSIKKQLIEMAWPKEAIIFIARDNISDVIFTVSTIILFSANKT